MTTALLTATSTDPDQSPTLLELVTPGDLEPWLAGLSTAHNTQAQLQQFKAASGELLWFHEADGSSTKVVAGWSGKESLAALGHLPTLLPQGNFQTNQGLSDLQVLGWGLGAYQFNRYRDATRAPAGLVLVDPDQAQRVQADVVAVATVRDLINTPAGDMLPSDLQTAAQEIADAYGAPMQTLVGDALLNAGFRTIHAVGRAATDAPRLIDFTWGDEQHPKVTLVGKGVCFDSGGLNIKVGGGMRTMKKDMGGAAQVLGLAQLIMSRNLPIRLRVLIPAVENAIAGNAYRPGDIIETYAGLTVEIDNTDAEGRLVLCDALALAIEEEPELMVDYATLTGAARVAVGTEIAAMFCTDDTLAADLHIQGQQQDDALWRLPLHSGYDHMLKSSVADVVNSASGGFAGATTAALFLQKFVGDTTWVHFDVMAFNTRSRPGHPEGGEAMGIRAMAAYIEERFTAPSGS